MPRPVTHHWKHGWIPLDGYAKAEKYRRKQGSTGLLARPVAAAAPHTDNPDLAKLPRIEGPHGLREDVVRANPGFSQGDEYKVNCVHCVNALEMRRRGYDVVATPLPASMYRQNGRSAGEALASDWQTPEHGARKFTPSSQAGARNMVNSWPVGARGWVIVNWKTGGSHIFAAERTPDGPQFVDPQRGKLLADPADYFGRAMPKVQVARVDDLTPAAGVTQFVTEATSQQRMISARNLASSSFAGY